MNNISENVECCGCGACMQKCPRNCIQMEANEEGFLYPVINRNLCVNCGLCVNTCPILNQTNDNANSESKVFAASNYNPEDLFNSSSGGIFILLAEQVINNNGIVFGAAYTESFEVKHIMIDSISELYKLQGSKYVQSDTGNTFKLVKKYLKNGTEVLFSGTPCQVEGLLDYLGEKYHNLFTVDIVCSGVPSPELWKEYLVYREHKERSKIKRIDLRSKKYGWQEYIISIDYENGKQYKKNRFEDLYMRAFRSGYSLRPSCYECKFKKNNRRSDITLADFWGIEKVAPEMNNTDGTSMVFINSEYGLRVFYDVADKIHYKEIEKEKAIACNPMMIQSFKKPQMRNDFYQYAYKKSFVSAVKKYCKVPLRQRIALKTNSIYRYVKSMIKEC